MTVTEAAATVGVSVPAVRARIATGKLRLDHEAGKPARVLREDVLAWMVERNEKAMATVQRMARVDV